MQMTNRNGISISLIPWILGDDYDYNTDPRTISATSLLKPTRMLILDQRDDRSKDNQYDVSDFLAQAYGHGIHYAIEHGWSGNIHKPLRAAGYPDEYIDKIRINPEDILPGTIPVFIEKRSHRQIGDWTISGKFDFIFDGKIQDHKSTSVYNYINGSNKQNYILQASIYRWLNPDIVTNEFFNINYIFTDWQKYRAKTSLDYPQARVISEEYKTLPEAETEQFILNKIAQLEQYWDQPEHLLPRCTPEELWMSESKYKFYAKPGLKRATKVFSDLKDAQAMLAANPLGEIKEEKGEPKRCGFCPVFDLCHQKDEYFDE